MEYGFELEGFIVSTAKPEEFVLVPPVFPFDDCGYLVEYRGKPDRDPNTAWHLAMAEVSAVDTKLAKRGFARVEVDTVKLPPAFCREALRLHGKNPSRSQGNIYGLDYKPTDPWARAGLHIHFSNRIYYQRDGKEQHYYGPVDIPKIVQALDKAFKSEIAAAKRIPGSYEMKTYGFEYRSLPASAFWLRERLIEVLDSPDCH